MQLVILDKYDTCTLWLFVRETRIHKRYKYMGIRNIFSYLLNIGFISALKFEFKISRRYSNSFAWEKWLMTYNKLLNFVPATKNVASTGLPTLRCGSQLAKR